MKKISEISLTIYIVLSITAIILHHLTGEYRYYYAGLAVVGMAILVIYLESINNR